MLGRNATETDGFTSVPGQPLRDDRTRKVHHLLYAPSFDAADTITAALAKIGNLASDGRPILGLDSRDLLDITLSADSGCYLIPAHVWTPW